MASWFVYEYITGGGLLHSGEGAASALLAEGDAMLQAVASDFALLADSQVTVLRDHRLQPLCLRNVQAVTITTPGEHDRQFESRASSSDGVLVIAPEFDQALLSRVRQVERCGGKLLGPGSELVALAADKHLLAEHLAACGVAVPHGVTLAAGEQVDATAAMPGFPSILKPRYGAGSLGVRLLESEEVFEVIEPSRWERFHVGMAASVSVLCGPGESVVLPAGEQLIRRHAGQPWLKYVGGQVPILPEFDQRAQRLATSVIRALPKPQGYLGIDLVLGEDPHGSQDVVIEINPRLTTSYLGLRQLVKNNLAQVWTDLWLGHRAESLQFAAGKYVFEVPE